MRSNVTIPDRPTITVPEAAAILGISKESAYSAVRKGELPVLMLGRRYVVPTARLRQMLGVDDGPLRI
jgi:excisionase family DNA binding protein